MYGLFRDRRCRVGVQCCVVVKVCVGVGVGVWVWVCAGGWVGVWVTRHGLPTCQLKVRACLHGILFVLAVEVHRTAPAA